MERSSLTALDHDLWSRTLRAAANDDSAWLGKLASVWVARSGFTTPLRRRQLAAAGLHQLRAIDGWLELPTVSPGRLVAGMPTDRFTIHPVGLILARRRLIRMLRTGAGEPGKGASLYPNDLEASAADLSIRWRDLRALVQLDLGSTMTPLLLRARQGLLPHNALPRREWRHLAALSSATLEDVFGLTEAQVGPATPSSRLRPSPPAASSSILSRQIHAAISKHWRSAHYQYAHSSTEHLAAIALMAMADGLLGLSADIDGIDPRTAAITAMWTRDRSNAALAVHLLFLTSLLEDPAYHHKTFGAYASALVKITGESEVGLLGLSGTALQRYVKGLRLVGADSTAGHAATVAAHFGRFLLTLDGLHLDAPALAWAGTSLLTPPKSLTVSLAWPAQLARIRTQARTRHDERGELLLDLLLATGARISSLILADNRSAILHGQMPYLNLYIGVKGKGRTERRHRAPLQAPDVVLAKIRTRVAGTPPGAMLVGYSQDQARQILLRLDGRAVHAHDIRRLVIQWRMLQAYSHPDPTGVNFLGRLAAEANWRGLSSLPSYAVALDWMGNQEMDEYFNPAKAWRCTAEEARRLSGLDTAAARHAFHAGTTPTLGDILETQREALVNDPARVARQAAVAQFAGLDHIEEVVGEVVEDELSLVWERDDVPVARGILLVRRSSGRPGRVVMADTWRHLKTGQRQEALWILASAPPMPAVLRRVATAPPYHFAAVPTSSLLLVRQAPRRGR